MSKHPQQEERWELHANIYPSAAFWRESGGFLLAETPHFIYFKMIKKRIFFPVWGRLSPVEDPCMSFFRAASARPSEP